MELKINENVFEAFPILESKRLKFRSFKKSDAGCLYNMRSNADVLAFMDTESHKSVNDSLMMIDAIQKSYAEKNGINWVVEEKLSGEMIGYIGFWRLMKEHLRAEIGYALHPSFWGIGYMEEAMKTILTFGFEAMNLHSVEANINPKNERSEKVLRKAGFIKEAHFRENYYFDGHFYDSAIYSLLKTCFCK